MSEGAPTTRWLVVTLMAPLASLGERAGNAERTTAARRARSALVGWAGAALGVRRADVDRQEGLRQSFRVASCVFGPGKLLADFHTFESLPVSRDSPQTRAGTLARRDELVTSITRRE